MITRENLNKIHELTKAITTAQDHASELIRIAQDRHNDRTHKLEREGKKIELTEKVLWDEVYYHPLGAGSQAGKILTKEHPEVFEAYKKGDMASVELKKYCALELDVDYTKLSLSDYLKLTEGMFTLLIEENNGKK